MPYHETVNKIIKLLEDNNCWYEKFEHIPVRTSEEAAKIRNGYTQHQGAKAMIVKIKGKSTENIVTGDKFIMLVLPGDMRFDNNTVKKLIGAKDMRFASEEEVGKITNGILPGGVPPFGNIFNLDVIVDPEVLKNEKIVFNAGDRCVTVGMYSKDYVNLVNPRVEKFVA